MQKTKKEALQMQSCVLRRGGCPPHLTVPRCLCRNSSSPGQDPALGAPPSSHQLQGNPSEPSATGCICIRFLSFFFPKSWLVKLHCLQAP